MSKVDLLKEAIKKKDGDQLFKAEEDFKALMGDEEDTVAFVFQHISSEENTLTSVARTTRGILSFGAVVKGEVDRHLEKGTLEKSPVAERKPVTIYIFDQSFCSPNTIIISIRSTVTPGGKFEFLDHWRMRQVLLKFSITIIAKNKNKII